MRHANTHIYLYKHAPTLIFKLLYFLKHHLVNLLKEIWGREKSCIVKTSQNGLCNKLKGVIKGNKKDIIYQILDLNKMRKRGRNNLDNLYRNYV